jgi:hypothetical protein
MTGRRTVTEFMVFLRKSDGSVEGMGRRTFQVPPRTGEYVTTNSPNGLEAFRIKAVIHPLEPASTAGDIVLEYVATDSGWPVY